MWRYIDPDGQVQGPFNSNEMHTWFESNYLQMELPICGMVSCPTDPFWHFTCFIGQNNVLVQQGQNNPFWHNSRYQHVFSPQQKYVYISLLA